MGDEHLEALATPWPGRERCARSDRRPRGRGRRLPRAPGLGFPPLRARKPCARPSRLPASGSGRPASVTGGQASPEGTLDLPENATIFPSPWSGSKPPPAPAPGLSMKNPGQDRRGAESRPPAPLTGRASPRPRVARPFPRTPPGVPPERGRPGTRGGKESAARRARTDSWRGRGSGRAGGGSPSNFPEKQPTCSRSDSKRGKKVQLPRRTRGLAKYFSNGLGFSCACLKH